MLSTGEGRRPVLGYIFFWVVNVALLGGLVGVTVANPAAGAVLTGLAATFLLLGPAARERRDRRRAVARARGWLGTGPDPVALAFAIGGPDRPGGGGRRCGPRFVATPCSCAGTSCACAAHCTCCWSCRPCSASGS